MSIIKVRVVADTEEDIFRDIEIEATDTFERLHKSIIAAFDFREDEMASFYMSNDQWERGEEIALMDMGPADDGIPFKSMSNTVLSDMITEPDQKIVYVYDFIRMWCFYIEVVEMKKRALSTIYPKVSMVFGASPEQDQKETDLFDDLLIDGEDLPKIKVKPELTGDPEIDAYLMEDDEDDDGGFENIDDLGDEYY
ncbi:MAG: plasmid pRiA4b ORF-3 family protein [Flavobacteriales bacterium]|nr:plasmid pRiA4b ORF-3 family protein [Flavobacteriales bacterium]